MRAAWCGVALIACVACGGESRTGETADYGGSGGSGATTGGNGTGAAGSEVTGDPVGEEDLVSAFAEVDCLGPEHCCAASGFPYDADACQETYASEFGQGVLDRVRGDGYVYDPQLAGDCVELRRVLVADCLLDDQDRRRWEACLYFDHPALLPGEPCSAHSQCVAGEEQMAYCDSTSLICITVEPGAQGESCVATCADATNCWTVPGIAVIDVPLPGGACLASDGLQCMTDGVCRPLPGIGEQCLSGPLLELCGDGAYCAYVPDGNLCTARDELGEPCEDSPYALATGSCVPEAYCSPSLRTCERVLPDGEACTDRVECASGNCVDGICGGGSTVDIGTEEICAQTTP